jgi:quinol monooxygenase YgiN
MGFTRCRSASDDSCPINLLHAALRPKGTLPYVHGHHGRTFMQEPAMPPTATATKIRVGLYVRLEAKPGQEDAVAAFLKSALPIVEREPATLTWYAMRLGPTSFGIYDTFPDDQGREAHLAGQVAAALMQKAPELLASPPVIQKIDILAAKLPD